MNTRSGLLLFSLCALLPCLTTSIFAQKTFENIDPTVSQFEIFRGSGDPDYTGALSFKLPLLKVPGRGGFGHDIELVYIHGSGVPASESASWVGLGWNLNLYQISCVPAYAPGVDDEVIADGKDIYHLSYPKGSTAIYEFADGWRPLDWSAIQIQAEIDANPSSPDWEVRKDYKNFTVTDVDGTRYIFSDRLRQESSRPLRNHCDQPDTYHDHPYYYVFKLSAILGSDYVDGSTPKDDIPDNGGGIDVGNWVKFEYTTPNEIITVGYSQTIRMEVNYLHKIKTPTHTATFNLTTGGNYLIYQGTQNNAQTKILSAIELNPGNTKVEFFTSRKWSWVKQLEGSQGVLVKQEGGGDYLRTSLDSIRISDSASNLYLPSYKFEYNGNPAETHNTTCGTDPWGYYTLKPFETHPTEADVKWTAWLLKRVVYPTGGSLWFKYETNRYQTYFRDFRGADGDNVVLGGGVRLQSQTVKDTLTGQTSVYQYQYALTNLRHPGGYGFLSAEPVIFDNLRITAQSSIGKNLRTEVHYPDVQITRMADGSKVRKYYTSAFSGVNGNSPSGQPYDPYENFENCYSTVEVQPDADIQAIPLGPGDNTGLYSLFSWTGPCPAEEAFMYFENTSCYTSTQSSTYQEEVLRGEAKEFDDNVQNIFLNQGSVNIPLFYNGWKRGHLTCEEFYQSTGDSYLDGKPVKRKRYFYNMLPKKTELYKITATWYDVTNNNTPHSYTNPVFVTSGWAQLTKTETELRIIPTATYLDIFDIKEFEYNLLTGTLKKQTDSNADGSKRITKFKYPVDFTNTDGNGDDYAKAIHAMRTTKHMFSPVIEKEIRELRPGQSEKVVAAELVKYRQTPSGQYLPYEFKKFSSETSVTDFVASDVVSGVFTSDSRYRLASKNEQYDNHGNLTLSYDALTTATPTTTVWAYNASLPIGRVTNATPSQVATVVFDDNNVSDWQGSYGTWTINNGIYQQTDAIVTSSWNNPKYYNPISLDDGVLEAQVRIDDSVIPRYAGITKFVNVNNFVRFEVRRTVSGGFVRIHARKTAVDVNFEIAKTINPNQWYRLRGEIQGTTAKLYLDGELLVTFTHANVDLAAGKIGLNTWASIASFDNVRFYPLNALVTSVSFDPGFFKINTKTDESGISSLFAYDALGRLTEIRDRSGNLLKEFDYFYSSPFNVSNPNHIESKTYRSATDFTTVRTYADGLGREAQTQQNEGTGSIKVGTVYDLLGRVSKVTKAYAHGSQAFDTNPIATANSYYAGRYAYFNGAVPPPDSDPSAFYETQYFADPLDRVSKQGSPGSVFKIGASQEKAVAYTYSMNTSTDLPNDYPTPNVLSKHRREDENDHAVDTFHDSFGNVVATIALPLSLKLTTVHAHDVLGNLIQTKAPNGLPTTYQYNTLGQLRIQDSPDAAPVEYLYDKNGNLRFVKDGKGLNGSPSYFIYYKYDVFNRKIEEGTMSNSAGNFSPANAESPTYPSNDGEIVRIKYHYDFAGYAVGLPQKNLAGRMDAIEYASMRFTQATAPKGYIFYSYDERGRVDWMRSHIPISNASDGSGSLSTHIEYDYDLQGNVTKLYFYRSFPPGASTDAFYVWYDYDELGRLKKVFANTVDVKPATAEAEYTYWPGGQVKRLVLGGTVQGVDYLYNSRDWLTQINHQNFTASQDPGGDGGGAGVPTLDRFGQIIGYNVQSHIANAAPFSTDYSPQFNGNIAWTIHKTFGNNAPANLTGWVFKYDEADRLSKANWGHYSGAWLETDSRYDLANITYDPVGNFSNMKRRLQDNTLIDMNYIYKSSSNQLDYVLGLNNQVPGNYTFDQNGNMIKDSKKLAASGEIAYDYRNLPTQAPMPGGTIYFDYDAKGQRVSKNDLIYVYGADGKVIAVYKIDGTHLYWNIWGLDLIGQKFYAQ